MEAEIQDKSIIPVRYRDGTKYTPADRDWLGELIDGQCTEAAFKTRQVKDEEGKVTGTEQVPLKRRSLNLDKLFDLAIANGLTVDKFYEQRQRPNAPGRLRMTIGNMLRAAARKRHGLLDLDENWVDADAAFIGGGIKTENRDGSKIAKVQDEAEAA